MKAFAAFAWAFAPGRLGVRRSAAAAGGWVGVVILLLQNMFDLALEVPAVCIGGPAYADDNVRDDAVLGCLHEHSVDLVLLLGYLKKLGPKTVRAYRGRILNIHPAMLPKFGGVGMYGINVHRAVLAAGEKETGVSIHWVDEIYDHGAIVAQCPVPVLEGDSAETLEARVIARGHELLIETLAKIADGRIPLTPR